MRIIVTGTSSGIGNALARHFLQSNHQVIGIGRKNNIDHPAFTFFEKDLSQPIDFTFLANQINTTEELVVINNAGTIGALQRISEQDQSDIEATLQLNTIVPMLLCQYILQQVPLHHPLTIINISSGAGKRPVPAWASYCASKAALDLFSQTIYLEEKERNRNIKVYSVVPGVVDTPMQAHIRTANNASFSSLQSFLDLKTKNELTDPATVAKKIEYLLNSPYTGQVIYSLRDISI